MAKFCPNCGKEVNENADVCVSCGSLLKKEGTTVNVNVSVGGTSSKSRLVTFLLCTFLGGLGIHRFYVGKTGTGVLWLLTAGCFGIGALVDWIMILCGTFRDKDNLPITNWDN